MIDIQKLIYEFIYQLMFVWSNQLQKIIFELMAHL